MGKSVGGTVWVVGDAVGDAVGFGTQNEGNEPGSSQMASAVNTADKKAFGSAASALHAASPHSASSVFRQNDSSKPPRSYVHVQQHTSPSDSVGAAVGDAVGKSVGGTVWIVGDGVGKSVGGTVWIVGDGVGKSVGGTVWVVGDAVGAAVVGEAVGWPVGDAVGTPVGFGAHTAGIVVWQIEPSVNTAELTSPEPTAKRNAHSDIVHRASIVLKHSKLLLGPIVHVQQHASCGAGVGDGDGAGVGAPVSPGQKQAGSVPAGHSCAATPSATAARTASRNIGAV